MTTTLTKTIVASAIATAIFAGSAFAQGGNNWNPERPTNPNTVAQQTDDRQIFAAHPNAYSKGETRPGVVAQYNEYRVFSGHPNSLHIARSELIVPGDNYRTFAETK